MQNNNREINNLNIISDNNSKNARIYCGKYSDKDEFLIDTEGGKDTDQVYEKIEEKNLSSIYLFRWFFNRVKIKNEQIIILISEIETYVNNSKNLESFEKPLEIKDYLLKIKNYLEEPLKNNWSVTLEVN